MLQNESSIIQDYFSFLKGVLIEVLECLSKGDPWQDHMMGYELPEHSDGIDSNKDQIVLFMQTHEYIEFHLEKSRFYTYLLEVCGEYIFENPHSKEMVDSLMVKIEGIL